MEEYALPRGIKGRIEGVSIDSLMLINSNAEIDEMNLAEQCVYEGMSREKGD